MTTSRKQKRRGFVMMGGGAKGLYEAGVIHAFHLTEMEFDVVTGSSIGAMNSVIYAEYLRRKRGLPAGSPRDAEGVDQALDQFVKAFHFAWLRMEHLNIIDDSEDGPLGLLKNDLGRSNLSLQLLARLVWWWTTPPALRPGAPWRNLAQLVREAGERLELKGVGYVLQEALARRSVAAAMLSAYLDRMGMHRALILPKSPAENSIRDTFTRRELVLRPEHLADDYRPSDDEPGDRVPLLDPGLALGDYRQAGVDVRLTRANYRTGRLEISAQVTPEDFVAYLQKQSWRLEAAPIETLPLGSYRFQVPGNPSAIGAALASGRFPGVFAPFPIDAIYDLDRPDNALLRRILASPGWLDDPDVSAELGQAYARLHPDQADSADRWTRLFAGWQKSRRLPAFFPRGTDFYVDGGAIDNTPSNSAVDATRDWLERHDLSNREVVLDLYVVFLHPEPRLPADKAEDPALHEVVGRTLRIQSAAALSSDASVVDTINRFGERGEDLGQALKLVLAGLRPLLADLDPGQKAALEARLLQQVREARLTGLAAGSPSDLLDRLEQWAQNTIDHRLPLQVTEVKIYPDAMPLDTLQFTRRLGYRKDKAIQMLAMGCYNTLWALRAHLEAEAPDLDEQDARSLQLARHWMGDTPWPGRGPNREAELMSLQDSWQCQRRGCVFHAQHCPHGALNAGRAPAPASANS